MAGYIHNGSTKSIELLTIAQTFFFLLLHLKLICFYWRCITGQIVHVVLHVGFMHFIMHPSVRYLYRLSVRVMGKAEVNHSWLWVKRTV